MSLKGDKYETAEEVKTRLENTVVLYDGDPVYITRVTGTEEADGDEIARVYFRTLPLGDLKGRETRKYLKSRFFDLTPFKMGYVNYAGNALYLTRTAHRQYKQGLSKNSLKVSACDNQEGPPLVGFAQLTASQDFVDMVRGSYPSLQKAKDMLKTATSVAITRNFAIKSDKDFGLYFLYYRGTKCALCFHDENSFRVPAKFRFLTEELREFNIEHHF